MDPDPEGQKTFGSGSRSATPGLINIALISNPVRSQKEGPGSGPVFAFSETKLAESVLIVDTVMVLVVCGCCHIITTLFNLWCR